MTYQERKEETRRKAIEYQREAGERCLSYSEIVQAAEYFEHLGKRYGLLKEFRREGVI